MVKYPIIARLTTILRKLILNSPKINLFRNNFRRFISGFMNQFVYIFSQCITARFTCIRGEVFIEIFRCTTRKSSPFTKYRKFYFYLKSNYKVCADIGVSTSCIWCKTVVIVTGAGPNYISKSKISLGTDGAVSPPLNIRVKSPNCSSLGIKGQVSLAVCVRAAVINVPFFLCDSFMVEFCSVQSYRPTSAGYSFRKPQHRAHGWTEVSILLSAFG